MRVLKGNTASVSWTIEMDIPSSAIVGISSFGDRTPLAQKSISWSGEGENRKTTLSFGVNTSSLMKGMYGIYASWSDDGVDHICVRQRALQVVTDEMLADSNASAAEGDAGGAGTQAPVITTDRSTLTYVTSGGTETFTVRSTASWTITQ